jgi:hypothetical protein
MSQASHPTYNIAGSRWLEYEAWKEEEEEGNEIRIQTLVNQMT